ncbi:hypothetical protein [Aureimonas sp. Leaf454]|uniref:hypothetical protein n=1 Tax=Aureimonas sp. Leaf454 TaxID=1736381 RepID=UPI000AA2B8D7|nr:hypothetical protein [Aureimonas sp. Leaf454]
METKMPLKCDPIGLSRPNAAAHVGMVISLFDKLVADGRMPRPCKAEGRLIWRRLEIEKAFSELPFHGELIMLTEERKNSFAAVRRRRAERAEADQRVGLK